jgi:hypothetical protein
LEKSELTTEEELREALEGERKPLKSIVLPENSNDIDQGGTAKEEKIGDKNLDKEKRLARAQYLTERDKKIQYGDKQAIAEYVKEASEIRRRLEQQKERSLAEYHLRQEEKSRLAIESRITPEDRQNEVEDIQKLERKRDNEINNIHDYFNCTEEFWEEYQKNGHEAYESPAGALITQADNGTWCCDIHRYQKVLEMPDRSLGAGCFTVEPVEDHFRNNPKPHLEALIEIANNKYDKLIQARREETLQDPDIKLKREIRDIDNIPTRPGGDVIYSARKITKAERAKIRRAEEEENEKNRKIYRGLYS